jgi:hypothetical protein
MVPDWEKDVFDAKIIIPPAPPPPPVEVASSPFA